MTRVSVFGVAISALACAAPGFAQDYAQAERAFSRAARSFTACLAASATSAGLGGSIAGNCLKQEAVFRETGVALRVARGASEQEAARETEADITDGLRIFADVQTRQLASAERTAR
jgi:hypothetical protein